MALKRHKHHIGSRYIEVYRASGEDFLSVAGGATCEAAAFLSRGAQVIVRMRGLPYDATPKQVLDFFAMGEEPVSVLDGPDGVLFVRRSDGRTTGDAFVLFATEDDAPKALSRHKKLIGSRYIELFRSTTAEVQQVLNRSLESNRTSSSSTPSAAPAPSEGLLSLALVPQHLITSGTTKDCVRLRGLPYEAQVEHILTFLDEFAKNIMVQGVHMVYNSQGHPSGEAFIQMDSEASAFLCAQQKHRGNLIIGKKQRYIEVFQCSGDDMNLVLTGGVTAATSPKVSPGPMTYQTVYYPTMGHTLPPPIVYWSYPTPPVSPAHYPYHPPPHPQTMIPEVISVGGGSPLPMPPPAGWPECPLFMVN